MKSESRGTLLLLLADTLTLFLLLAGGLAAFLPVSRFEVDALLLLSWCGLFSMASAALFTWRQGGWTALGLLGAEALFVWRLWEELAFSIWLDGGYLNGAAEFLLLAFALALALGWVVVRARRWYLAALIVLTPLLPAITGGVLPNWTALTASTAGWGAMLLSALYSRRDKARLARGILLSLGGMGALLLTLNLALPMEGYDRPQWATDARDSLVDTLSKGLSGDWPGNWDMPELLEGYLELETAGGGFTGSGSGIGASFAVGDDGTVDLLSAGPRSYSGRVVLEISGGRPGTGYDDLRGGTAAVYTGESWEGADAEFEIGSIHPEFIPALVASDQQEAVMTVRSLYPDTTAYIPYLATGFPDSVKLQADGSAVKRRGLREYEVTYLPKWGYDAPLEGEAAEMEELYREYVYENYLDVPEAARAALEPLAAQMRKISKNSYFGYPEQWYDAMYYSQQAMNILKRTAVYDLNTPAMEPGEDFVTRFLEEGRGYCVHFATAGALLLRMKGIPTRYVSGYMYQTGEDGGALVRDSNAHAWVEMYVDGRGWLPADEMTPGGVYLSAEEAAVGIAPEEPGEVPEEEPEEEPEAPEEADEPEEPEAPEVPETPEAPVEKPETPEPSGAGEEAPGGALAEPVDLSWLWTAAKAAVILAVPLALYRLGISLRRRERELPDANRSAIRAYLRWRRLASWGAEENGPLTELAQKAKFSQHTLTDQERETAWTLTDEAAARLEERLSGWKRAVFRFLRPVWF